MEKIVRQMLREANENYPDDCIASQFDLKTGDELQDVHCGDTLALFIGREIIAVLEGNNYKAKEARKCLEQTLTTAAQELDRVIAHFRGTLP